MGITTKLAGTVLAAGAGLALAATPAAAAGPEPWEPWIQPEFTLPAGKYCEFPIRLEVISQDIERRTTSRYPDGTIHREEYRGPLTSYWYNEDTGDRHFSDASGELYMEYYPDGSPKRATTVGPVGVGFREQDDYPKGYYTLDGFHMVGYDTDGTRSMMVDNGDEIDVCAALD